MGGVNCQHVNVTEDLLATVANNVHVIGTLLPTVICQTVTQMQNQRHMVYVQTVLVIAILISQETTVNWLHVKNVLIRINARTGAVIMEHV